MREGVRVTRPSKQLFETLQIGLPRAAGICRPCSLANVRLTRDFTDRHTSGI